MTIEPDGMVCTYVCLRTNIFYFRGKVCGNGKVKATHGWIVWELGFSPQICVIVRQLAPAIMIPMRGRVTNENVGWEGTNGMRKWGRLYTCSSKYAFIEGSKCGQVREREHEFGIWVLLGSVSFIWAFECVHACLDEHQLVKNGDEVACIKS